MGLLSNGEAGRNGRNTDVVSDNGRLTAYKWRYINHSAGGSPVIKADTYVRGKCWGEVNTP